MNKVNNIIGYRKMLFNQLIKLVVFFYFIQEVVTGRMSPVKFYRFVKRLLLFLSKMKDNKYVKIGRYTKLNLYVPAFPSKAFFKSCRKVATFEGKLPCVSVLISVTSACRYDCEHCYQKLDLGKDVEINLLVDAVTALQSMGVTFFNIEGGEPFLVFDRLKKICEAIDIGEIWVNSTGDGMNKEKLLMLKDVGVKGIMFSLHSYQPESINKFMQSNKAWDNLTKGIELCHEAGLEIATNTCLMKKDFYNQNFQSVLEIARDLGVSIIQLIKPKPSGGWLESELDEFSQTDLEHIEKLVYDYNNLPQFKNYPFIAAQIVDEKENMFGCTAGGTDRFYINAKGDVQPCEFLNISFGNIKREPFENIYKKMRSAFNVPGDVWLCEKYSKEVGNIFRKNNLKVLPLNPELSNQIIDKWDRGNCPEFYDKTAKL